MGGGNFNDTIWGINRVFGKFLHKIHVRLFKFSFLNFSPLNLYPTIGGVSVVEGLRSVWLLRLVLINSDVDGTLI